MNDPYATLDVNESLALWGELPANEAEAQLAEFVEQASAALLTPGGPGTSAGEAPPKAESLLRVAALLVDWLAGFRQRGQWGSQGAQAESVAAVPPLPDPFPGEFGLLRQLGAGAFGTVWLADDLALRPRQIALKTLRLDGGDRADKLAALRNEAGIMARFQHPNIVQVHAWRQSGDDSYLVLQFVPGGSLQARLDKEGPLPWHVAARYVADVGEGLIEVHGRGIVHRDIKPANILWDPERDEALLTDFGIAAHLSEGPSVVGTPLYMALEAFAGVKTPAQDVYSLAATLFHLLTGEAPFPASKLSDLKQRIGLGLAADDRRCRDMPQAIEEIVRAGLTPAPAERPPLREFVSRLRGALNQSLADSLLPAAASGAVNLELRLSREVGAQYLPLSVGRPAQDVLLRNMKKVPRRPAQVLLRTGDRVRIELSADRDGHAAVFNVGPTGDLNLLYPEEATHSGPIRARERLQIVDVEMTPPPGRERLFALWTNGPFPLDQLRALAAAPAAYVATRSLNQVRQAVLQLGEGCRVIVLELDHAS